MTKKYPKKRKKRAAARYAVALLLLAAALFVLYRVTVAALPLSGVEPASGAASLSSQATSQPEPESPDPASQVAVRPQSSQQASTSGPETLPVPDSIFSSNLILMRLSDRAILMEEGSEDRIYPASLTKIMTALVVIEQMPDLEERVLLPASLFEPLREENASVAGFLEDEKVRAKDLLYGILLPSGAECCLGLANHIAGSEEAFTTLMNQKAAELGMVNTHFTNTTGLHDPNHYTTVKDLARLLEYALQNETFRKAFTTERYSTASTNKHPDGITFYSTMFKGLEAVELKNGEFLGGKTGFTDEAGLCLASLAKLGDNEYILITVGAKGNHQTEPYHLEDAVTVYNSLDS